ncbi:MAG TPA: 50S ribosomal protein L11 methyltransferase [Prolixibacteraceae bacterium]|nr:50S ribosomal protein L11 methyltransferase [Prolixibacteraceae bacterium]
MNYLKYTFTLTPDTQEFREILIATLSEVGFDSFVENETSLEAFIQEELSFAGLLEPVDFESLFAYLYQVENVPDQNWNEVWEKNYFKPLVVAGRCVVRAPFHTDYPAMEFEIVIEPNMAFGTGNHETTSMMMEFILESDMPGKKVLDMGCGTGILSILASKCGARSVTAIDIDKWSYEGTVENVSLNGATGIIPVLGDATVIPDEKFDLILANIHKNIIMSDLPAYFKVMDQAGAIIVSGFYEADLDDILKVAEELGLVLEQKKVKNNWCSARLQLKK